MSTPGENVDEWAVGGDGPLRRTHSARSDGSLPTSARSDGRLRASDQPDRRSLPASGRTAAVLLAVAVTGLVVALLTPQAAGAAASAATTTATSAAKTATDEPTFLPGAGPGDAPHPTPTGPIYSQPSPTHSPTRPPTARPPVPPTIADPGDITTGTTRFHGRGTPHHTVRVTAGATVSCTTEVRRDRSWSCLGRVTSGPQQVFTVADLSDTTLGTASTPASDVITPPVVVTSGTTGGTVAGTGRPGSTVTVSLTGTTTAGSGGSTSARVGSDGRWVLALPRSIGSGSDTRVTVTAVQTASTAAGYRSDLRSGASAPVALTVDRTAPAAPRITSPRASATVRTQPLTIGGSGEPGAVVTAYADHAPVCTATVEVDRSWQCSTTDAALRPGTRSLTAMQHDAAGNTSPSSSRTPIVVTAASTSTASSGPTDDTDRPGTTATAGPTSTSARPGSTPAAVPPASGPGSGGDTGGTSAAGKGWSAPGGTPDWSGPAGDWTASTSYDADVPTIQAVFSWRTVLVATAVAAGFLVLVAAPLALVAAVARGRVRSPFSALLGRNVPRAGRSRADDALPAWVSCVTSVAVVTVCTMLGSGVALEARYVRLTAAVAVGSALLTAALVLATRWAAGRDRHLVGYRVSPWLVLAAVVACALTRAADLSPALVVGVALVPTGRADLGTGPMRLGAGLAARARSATWRSTALLVLAVVGWVVHSIVGGSGIWGSFVSEVAITLCVGGLGAVVATLLPFAGSAGAALLEHARGRYVAIAAVATALAAALSSGTSGTHVSPVALAWVVALCVAAAAAAWLWSRRTDAASRV